MAPLHDDTFQVLLVAGLVVALFALWIYVQSKRSSPDATKLAAQLRPLSPEALALLVLIRPSHVTAGQALDLGAAELSSALSELREAGLLIPVLPPGAADGDPPSLYYPKWATPILSAALHLVAAPDPPVVERVRAALAAAGYPSSTGAGAGA